MQKKYVSLLSLVRSTSEEFRNAAIAGHFGFVFRKTWTGNPLITVTQSFFRPHQNEAGVFKSLWFRERFSKATD